MKAGGHVVFGECGGGEERREGERAGEHISLIPSENFHSSPALLLPWEDGGLEAQPLFFLNQRNTCCLAPALWGWGAGAGRRSRPSHPGLAKEGSSAWSGRSDLDLCYPCGPPARL